MFPCGIPQRRMSCDRAWRTSRGQENALPSLVSENFLMYLGLLAGAEGGVGAAGALALPFLEAGGPAVGWGWVVFCGGEAGARGTGSGADNRCDRCHKS